MSDQSTWPLTFFDLNGSLLFFSMVKASGQPIFSLAADGLLESLKIKMKEQEHAKNPMSPAEILRILDKVD